MIKTDKLIEYSILSGIVFFFVFNISIHFAYGIGLNKLAPNLKYNDIVYNDSNIRYQYFISQAINQNHTNGVELVGNVTHVADGDTLDINGITIRLSLVNTPERGQPGFKEAKNFVNSMCLGKKGELDVDDGQRRGDRYGREIGVVYCNGINLNEKLMDNHLAKILTDYCDISQFSNEKWAKSDCSLSHYRSLDLHVDKRILTLLTHGANSDSQPIPSPSLSNPWGSGGKTLKSLYEISEQFKSGGGGDMHTSGYEESHLSDFA